MPSGRRSDYIILIVVGVLAAAVVVGMFLAPERRGAEGPPVRSSRNPHPEGALAVYRLLDGLGYDVSRGDRPLMPDALDDADVLMLIDPAMPVSRSARDVLRRWTAEGGVLVTTRDVLPGADEVETTEEFDETEWDESSRWFRQRPYQAVGKDRAVPPGDRALPLARDVTGLHLETDRPLVAAPEGWREPGAAAVPLLADAAGLRAAGWPVGDGWLIVLSDGSLLSNARLTKADNAVAAVNLAAAAVSVARGPRVVFHEFHFPGGPGRGGWAVVGDLLLSTSGGWAVLVLTGAGLLLLWLKGRRLGPRRNPYSRRRRSKVEFVESVAGTYRSRGANRVTLCLVFDWFLSRAARRVGLPESAPSEQVAQRLARLAGTEPAAYRRTFAACAAATEGGHLATRRLHGLLRSLARIESEAIHGSSGRA